MADTYELKLGVNADALKQLKELGFSDRSIAKLARELGKLTGFTAKLERFEKSLKYSQSRQGKEKQTVHISPLSLGQIIAGLASANSIAIRALGARIERINKRFPSAGPPFKGDHSKPAGIYAGFDNRLGSPGKAYPPVTKEQLSGGRAGSAGGRYQRVPTHREDVTAIPSEEGTDYVSQDELQSAIALLKAKQEGEQKWRKLMAPALMQNELQNRIQNNPMVGWAKKFDRKRGQGSDTQYERLTDTETGEQKIEMKQMGQEGSAERLAKKVAGFGARFSQRMGKGKGKIEAMGSKVPTLVKIAGLAGIGGGLAGLGKMIIDSSPILQSMMKLLSTGIMFYLRPIGDLLGFIIRPFALMMLKHGVKFYKQVFPHMMKIGKVIGDGLAKFLDDPLASLSGFGVFLAESLGNIITGAFNLDEFSAGVTAWWDENIANPFGEKWDELVGWFENLDILGTIGAAWTNMTTWFSENFGKIGTWLGTAWESTVTWFSENLGAVATTLGAAWDTVTGWFSENLSKVSDTLGAAWKTFTDSWKAFTDTITTLTDTLTGYFYKAWSTLYNSIADLWNWISEQIRKYSLGAVNPPEMEKMPSWDDYKNPQEDYGPTRDDLPSGWGEQGKFHEETLQVWENFQKAKEDSQNILDESNQMKEIVVESTSSIEQSMEKSKKSAQDTAVVFNNIFDLLEVATQNAITKIQNSGGSGGRTPLPGRLGRNSTNIGGMQIHNETLATWNKYMADGGVVDETIEGVGTQSGQRYQIGEAGPEAIIPLSAGKKGFRDKLLERLFGIPRKLGLGGVVGSGQTTSDYYGGRGFIESQEGKGTGSLSKFEGMTLGGFQHHTGVLQGVLGKELDIEGDETYQSLIQQRMKYKSGYDGYVRIMNHAAQTLSDFRRRQKEKKERYAASGRKMSYMSRKGMRYSNKSANDDYWRMRNYADYRFGDSYTAYQALTRKITGRAGALTSAYNKERSNAQNKFSSLFGGELLNEVLNPGSTDATFNGDDGPVSTNNNSFNINISGVKDINDMETKLKPIFLKWLQESTSRRGIL